MNQRKLLFIGQESSVQYSVSDTPKNLISLSTILAQLMVNGNNSF